MILIKSYDHKKLSKNFHESEIWDARKTDERNFEFDEKLIKASQILRDELGEPININSTKRDDNGNREVGGKPDSQHLHGKAIDLGNAKLPALLNEALNTKNALYRKLRNAGINGFGIYPNQNFVHLDTRENGGLQTDNNFGNFASWGNWWENLSQKKK